VSGPLISLVIPTRKRPERLLQCLDSLCEQTYPREKWEVVLVIDGEDDHIEPLLANRYSKFPLRIIHQAHSGCGFARNQGARCAAGQFLVFTDDDCRFPADWLARYAERFLQAPERLVAGRAVNALSGNLCSETTQLVIDYLLSHLNSRNEDASTAIGNNFGVPAQEFRNLGGFGQGYFQIAGAEDRDFAWRWKELGKKIVFAPELTVYHWHELTLASFVRQHFHYGRGARLLYDPGANPAHSRPRIQGIGFYAGLLLRPFSLTKKRAALSILGLILLSQGAHCVGFLSRGRTPRRKFSPASELRPSASEPEQ